MSFNSLTDSWDFALPPALPEISDDQFLTLLNQQFESHPPDLASKPQPTANPQALTRFPVLLNLSPLVSEESSPSPPGSSTDPPAARSRKVSEHHRVTRSSDISQPDDHNKRKASYDEDADEDDEDGQPQHKSFHGEGPSRKSSTRRKSVSGANQKDESRLLKRKEQNRAAQRAFRERKEKHVRDLEEKVALLEAKSDMQAVENENLRDMLGRLQQENRNLKESTFNFTVPNSNSGATDHDSLSQSPTSLSHSPPSSNAIGTDNNTPNTRQSPPIFEQNMAYFSPHFFNLETLPASPAPPDISIYGNMKSLVVPNQGPYITLASNPYTMSFAEQVPFSSFLADSGASSNASIASASVAPEGAMSPRSLNELFGGGFDALSSFGNGYDMFASTAAAGRQISSAAISPANIMQIATSGQIRNNDVQAMDVSQPQSAHKDCPKTRDDMGTMIASSQPTTFGPPVPTDAGHANAFNQMSASSSRSDTPRTESPYSFGSGNQERSSSSDTSSPFSAAGKHMAEAVSSCDDIPRHLLPRTTPNPNNIPLDDAWDRVSKHPQFLACDMDELCVMLTAKAKCDGTQKVLEPESFKHLLSKIPDMAQQSRK